MTRSNAGEGVKEASVARVSLPKPVLQGFHYRVPERLRSSALPGTRVVVPFGRRRETGVIEALLDPDSTPDRKLREIERVLDPEPVLSAELLDLCGWVADYYVAPAGLVYRAALPPGLLGGGSRESAGLRRQVVRILQELPTLTEREAAFGRARRQREAYETLESIGGQAEVAHMERRLGFGRGILSGLVDRGLVEITNEIVERDPFSDVESEEAEVELNPQQQHALADLSRLTDRSEPGVAVLRGVTGSGKTVVYIRLMRHVVEHGRGAILLVPEISLTPQTVARVRAEFGDEVAVLHSGLSDGERQDAWRALREGRKRVAVGTRSAIFAPVSDLGVIIVDEEHDGSYKQGETPRYSARSVAIVRAERSGALCLLGSATPSLESWARVRSGAWTGLELSDRATPHPLPQVELVDLREEEGPVPIVLSDRLRKALETRIDRKEQSILLLNRRGHSTWVSCDACSWIAVCRSCNVSLTWHRSRGRLVCHHCAYEEPARERCPECGEETLIYTGVGTEQVERRLGELFPGARIARMDVDTTGRKWSHRDILDSVRRNEVDILLGTQMISKGLDLPGVTLVGVIDADVGLNLPDFRASERTFQLLAQVAGRAGRGTRPGEVLVQTSRPSHFAIRSALQHDYEGFARRELSDREEPGYPPHLRLANLVISGRDGDEVESAALALGEWLEGLVEARPELTGTRLLGPAPCPIDRLRGRWRWHMLIKQAHAGRLGAILRFAATHAPVPGGSRLEIDRDPENLL
ncbi:MAG: primosomal protein N' [marine benthic group bacterium]|nr:primosomal protein N' [Gemmatimonadota bacterium]MCL7978209.1 primosomal protein N' [Gemmatimonadota bacterium]MCL7981428.1 primosomal protein N' [Gemmatimonadota bacterium]MCL7989596.1 primosomal protein N' [Gemmatimonadota bacterium]